MTVKDQVLSLNYDVSTLHSWFCREGQMYTTIIELASSFCRHDITHNEAHSVLMAMLGDYAETTKLLQDLLDRRSTRCDFVNRVCRHFFKENFKEQRSVSDVSDYLNLGFFRNLIKGLRYGDKIVAFSPEGKQLLLGTSASVFLAEDIGLTRQEFLDLQELNTRIQRTCSHVQA